MLDDDFDLRPYLHAMTNGWLWILLSAVLAAVLALAVSFVIPPTYDARALVFISDPRDVVQLDPGTLQAEVVQLPRQAFPEIALSDTVLEQLLADLPAGTTQINTITELRDILHISAPVDPSLLRLTAAYSDPDLAAEIVNTWALIFITESNETIGTQGDTQVASYTAQREEARLEMLSAENALIDFRAADRSQLLRSELEVLTTTHRAQLEQQQTLLQLGDAIALQRQILATETASGTTTAGDQFAYLLIQAQALGLDSTLPLEVHLDGAALEPPIPAQQELLLNAIDQALAQRAEQIAGRLSDIEPALLRVQLEVETLSVEEQRLRRSAQLAEEKFTALSRKLDEQRILAQDLSSGLRLTSAASTPDEPATPRKDLNTLIGALLGGIIGAAALIYGTWRRATGHSPEALAE